MFMFFFFQAEDGIRDADVTGVQTCALPICNRRRLKMAVEAGAALVGVTRDGQPLSRATPMKLEQEADPSKSLPVNRYRGERSEERRVGKEWRTRSGTE